MVFPLAKHSAIACYIFTAWRCFTLLLKYFCQDCNPGRCAPAPSLGTRAPIAFQVPNWEERSRWWALLTLMVKDREVSAVWMDACESWSELVCVAHAVWKSFCFPKCQAKADMLLRNKFVGITLLESSVQANSFLYNPFYCCCWWRQTPFAKLTLEKQYIIWVCHNSNCILFLSLAPKTTEF